MRFEIKTGGIVAILVGVGVLSGAVFALGVLAGYDIGRESQVSTAQIATTYPLASEATESSPAAASSEVGRAAEESSPKAAASTQAEAAATPPLAAATEARAMPKPHATPPKRTAAAEVPPPAEMSVPPEESPKSSGAPPAVAGPPAPGEHTAAIGNGASSERAALPAPRYRRRPYNIQIEAAMDRNGANSMAQRLQRLGYTPHLVPTLIGGQTWYKVEVGPYATQDEAAAAQEQLRQKYNSAYGGGSAATQPAGAGGSSDDSGTVANPSD